ncbi:hypothetical protein ACFL42_05210 [Candidatus Omnitrophota bacterium]
MVILTKLIGIVLSILGIYFAIKPEFMKRMLKYHKDVKKLHTSGVIRLCIGVVLLLAASNCRSSFPIAVLGILAIIGGVAIFAIKPKKMQSMIDWWLKKTDNTLRAWSAFPIIIGLIILNCA